MKKLQQIKLISHPAFKENATLALFQASEKTEDIPTFYFLTGENGSGKTSILDLIYSTLGETKDGYLVHTELLKDMKAELTFVDDGQSIVMKIDVEDQRIGSDNHPESLKVIYNKVDLNFKKPKVTTATAVTVDEEENPREQSEDLSEVIPQLLVNIKAQDDTLIADYVREKGTVPQGDIGKLQRFTKAFERMFDGTKTFKTVRPHEGELKIIFIDNFGKEVDLGTFSTGEKQIIYRVGHLLKDLENLSGALILIDEPETSLHPKWQKKYVRFLIDVFSGLDVQFIIATHSPYLLQGIKDCKSVCYRIDRAQDQIGAKIGFYKNMIGDGPSLNLINYRVYEIADELLHIELFTALEIRVGGYKKLKSSLDSDPRVRKVNGFRATVAYPGCSIGDTIVEPLPISIRNKIHRADELARPGFNENDIKESIEIMLEILST